MASGKGREARGAVPISKLLWLVLDRLDDPGAADLAGERGGGRGCRVRERRSDVVSAQRLCCQLAVNGLWYAGAEVARFLGVTASAMNQVAVSKETLACLKNQTCCE
jgi:hypothetical protein